MTNVHKFSNFTGADKKEIVIYTILGGFHVAEMTISPTDQMLLEEIIELIWWAAHEAVFAVKTRCKTWCCSAKAIKPSSSSTKLIKMSDVYKYNQQVIGDEPSVSPTTQTTSF